MLFQNFRNVYKFTVQEISNVNELDKKLKDFVNNDTTFVYKSNLRTGNLRFIIFNKLNMRNSFNPVFNGKTTAKNGSIEVKGTFKYFAFTKIILIAMYSFLAVMIFFIYLIGGRNDVIVYLNSPSGTHTVNAPWWTTYGFVGMFLLFISMIQVIGVISSRSKKEQILQFIQNAFK